MTTTTPTSQMPGAYRYRAGGSLVTALNDGSILIPFEYLSGITEAEGTEIYRSAGRRAPFVSAINAFLVQRDGHTALVDTGAGQNMGPTAGRLLQSMAAAGVAPEQVDTILLTHLHGDHIGGMLDQTGMAVFPAAEILLSQAELAFWTDPANEAAAPEARRGGFINARATLAAYGERVRPFQPGAEPIPGVEAIALPGHTIGHTGYFVGEGDNRVLIWADVYHVSEIQSRKPDVTIGFDADPAQARATRRAIQDRAVAEGFVVAGMHMHFPCFSRMAKAGEGCAILPLPWQTDL